VLRTLASMPFFKQHPCYLTYFLATAQESKQRKPLATKVLNRKKWLILGSLRMYPFTLHSNGVLAICPKNKPFLAETLKAGKQWRSHQRLELKSYNHSFFDEKLSWQSYKIIFIEPDPAGQPRRSLLIWRYFFDLLLS
jgi:hypothetical protein